MLINKSPYLVVTVKALHDIPNVHTCMNFKAAESLCRAMYLLNAWADFFLLVL